MSGISEEQADRDNTNASSSEDIVREDKDSSLEAEDKGHTFRKRRLSLTNLRELAREANANSESPEIEAEEGTAATQNGRRHDTGGDTAHADEKAHSFRKRRLSLTHSREDGSPASGHGDHDLGAKRNRRNSDASVSTHDSNGNSKLKSRTAHAAELLAHPPPSPAVTSSLPKLYQQAAPPQQLPLLDSLGDSNDAPKWKKRHTRHADERSLPFPRDIVGTFSCHGVEPIYDSDFQPEFDGLDEDDDDDDEWVVGSSTVNESGEKVEKPTMAAKINQDRGGVAFPYGNCPKTALFAVYDGHGQGGELVSQFALHEVQRLLEKHPDFKTNIEKAFKETFVTVDSSLKDECLIEPLYAGTTACVALLRDNELILSNVGDSRAVLARKITSESWEAIDLTKDQNPDLAEEQERIEEMGGFVSPPPEPGLSARVWLDGECTQIGLAMARSIGDHAVKPIGVIAEPVVSFHQLQSDDDFVILATDGVWEFISSAEAVQVVSENLHKGATKACRALIEAAAAKWHDEEGDYRDDITALVIRLKKIWDGETTNGGNGLPKDS